MSKPPTDKQPPFVRSTHGLVSIGLPVGRITQPLFGKQGLAAGALVVDWPAIVGSAVAAHTLPLRVRFAPNQRVGGVLEIKVAPGGFATELAHLEPLILDRINAFFGWGAVERIKLRQGPLPRRAAPPTPTQTPDQAAPLSPSLARRLESITDPDLRQALVGLGRALVKP